MDIHSQDPNTVLGALAGVVEAIQINMRELATALLVGVLSALGSSYMTTRDLSHEMVSLKATVEKMNTRFEKSEDAREVLIERVTRMEATVAANGRVADAVARRILRDEEVRQARTPVK